MHKSGDIVMVKRELKNENELYEDCQGIPLEITEICGLGHRDYDESMEGEPLYAFKTPAFEVPFTLYEREIEDYIK